MMDKDQKADPVASNHGWVAHVEGLSLSLSDNSKQTPPNFPREAMSVNPSNRTYLLCDDGFQQGKTPLRWIPLGNVLILSSGPARESQLVVK